MTAWRTPVGIKISPTQGDASSLMHVYLYCAERLKEIGSSEVAVPPGNRYIGGFAHGMRQSQYQALEFEHLQETMRHVSWLLKRYGKEDVCQYEGMLYQRYVYEGEYVLVPAHWDKHLIAANIAKVRLLGADEERWA